VSKLTGHVKDKLIEHGLRRSFVVLSGRAGFVVMGILLLLVIYMVGIYTRPRPTEGHYLGFVAHHAGPLREPGGNLPLGPRCEQAGNDACSGNSVLTWAPRRGLRIDLVVAVNPNPLRCGRAIVDVVVSGTRAFWRDHPHLGSGMTRWALGWGAASKIEAVDGLNATHKQPVMVAANPDPQAALRPSYFPAKYLRDHRLRGVKPYYDHDREIRGVVGGVSAWRSRGGRGKRARAPQALHFRFSANWVKRRAFGSCYIILPSLPANGAIPGLVNATKALTPDAATATDYLRTSPPFSFGRVVLDTPDDLDLGATAPDPSEYQNLRDPDSGSTELSPAWSCEPSFKLDYLQRSGVDSVPSNGRFVGNACGSVAVVEAASADEIRIGILLIMGILFAVWVERGLDRWKRWVERA
jgi:hypothetical protein